MTLSWILIFAAAVLAPASASERTRVLLTDEDCSREFELDVGDVIAVKARPFLEGHIIPNACNITFHTKDLSGRVVFAFSEDNDNDNPNFIYDYGVSLRLYALEDEQHHSYRQPRLAMKYSRDNTSALQDRSDDNLGVGRILVVIDGQLRENWSLYFTIRAVDGPISDYPFSVAGGVVALSLACTVVFSLLVTCCCCYCCCSDGAQAHAGARRRRRMINQLTKEGYSVTRDYGTISATTPILTAELNTVDIFAPPITHPQLSRWVGGASNYDPPPSYDSVRSHQGPSVSQQQQVVGGFSRPVTAGQLHGDDMGGRPQLVSVPEAVLVVIETNTPVAAPPHTTTPLQATAPPASTDVTSSRTISTEVTSNGDLMHFEISRDMSAGVDLLGGSVDIERLPPPLFVAPRK